MTPQADPDVLGSLWTVRTCYLIFDIFLFQWYARLQWYARHKGFPPEGKTDVLKTDEFSDLLIDKHIMQRPQHSIHSTGCSLVSLLYFFRQ